ncbi:MAG: GH92 family glycosyl hydrolase [Prevotellaceae bacterium]|jgi:predicted alpha-1,2-mannosidase|nr:GH92 family glycosyl hydrolase [Prevotellaceae bacterium]
MDMASMKKQRHTHLLQALGALLITWTAACAPSQKRLTDYANPLFGTTTLWDSIDIGYTPTHRTWGAEVFPGASLPNAMVQVSPVTRFRSGSGYQYEDTVIFGFTHTNKGHWNLCHVPLLPVTGAVSPYDYCSGYSHDNEEAHPGYYRVFLERYGVNAELTSTLRCAYHRYSYPEGQKKKLLADLSRSNERVREWHIAQQSESVFFGFQHAGEKIYFYAVANYKIQAIDSLHGERRVVPVIHFAEEENNVPLELKIGFSFVSVENAKDNLAKEMEAKTFADVRAEASGTWEDLLSKIQVWGGTERQRTIFYSSLYRAFLWPALRSDANGDFTDIRSAVANEGFRYYTDPSFWDDHRNKLVLLGMLSPSVAVDVIRSITDRGGKTGFMPTFFHGDHAAVFVAGAYLRGLRGFDVDSAYHLLLRNATIESRSRPHLNEYMEKGYIPEPDLPHPNTETVASAGVTKTLEYAYDDYAVALLAKALNDTANYAMLMRRTGSYKNLFDPSSGLMRGRLANGEWVQHFDPYYPYYEYMYREANAWQSSFYAPHDTEGLIGLYKSRNDFENKLDSLFAIPWKGYEAYNFSGFIGQYCHGNQPDHNFPYLYYFVGKQEKSQALLDTLMNHFYGMGKEGLALAGMDDAGEMSSWYVFNAIGLYTFSPADEDYIISVPLFDKVLVTLGNATRFTIRKENCGRKITNIAYDGQKVDGWFISHTALMQGKELVIETE